MPSRPTPANAIVVEVLAALRAKHLDHHTVEVEALHQHPGEGAQKEEVKQDSHDFARQLGQGTRPFTIKTFTPLFFMYALLFLNGIYLNFRCITFHYRV